MVGTDGFSTWSLYSRAQGVTGVKLWPLLLIGLLLLSRPRPLHPVTRGQHAAPWHYPSPVGGDQHPVPLERVVSDMLMLRRLKLWHVTWSGQGKMAHDVPWCQCQYASSLCGESWLVWCLQSTLVSWLGLGGGERRGGEGLRLQTELRHDTRALASQNDGDLRNGYNINVLFHVPRITYIRIHTFYRNPW